MTGNNSTVDSSDLWKGWLTYGMAEAQECAPPPAFCAAPKQGNIAANTLTTPERRLSRLVTAAILAAPGNLRTREPAHRG